MAKNSLALPDNLVQLLSAADQARGFPSGTMASVLQQEVGGQLDRFLADPTTPHYPTGVAPNGKRSSAFGLFGILESTARDPGYGVQPLKDKSLAEQVRFAADYLAARSKNGGGLKAGLAGYGEGGRYADQVVARINEKVPAGQPAVAHQPPEPVAAALPSPAPVVVAQAAPATTPTQPTTLAPAPVDPEKDPWLAFNRQIAAAAPVAMGMDYGKPGSERAAVAVVKNQGMSPAEVAALYDIPLGGRPNFGAFQGLARLGRRAA